MTTSIVFATFGWHIANAGVFEMRTVVAMTLRTAAGLVITTIAWYALVKK